MQTICFKTESITGFLRTPAFIFISIVAVFFGFWFATKQIKAVVPDGFATYPKPFFILTIFKCYLTILAFYGLVNAILLILSNKLTPLAIATSFTPLFLVNFNCPLYWILAMIVFYNGILLATVLDRTDYHRLARHYLNDALFFIMFFLVHLCLTSRFSPLHWGMAILTADGYYTDEAIVLSPMFRGYVLAKQYAFSFIDHSQWAGIMHTPFLLNSPLMQLLTLIFDLPSASYEAFHQVLMTLYFILIVSGSFGFYLFLKYAAKVNVMFAVWGGILFSFSGSPIIDTIMGNDSGAFFSSYAVFPYALLLISLAFEKNNKVYALWAAVALAMQLFIFAPHPEGLLYSSLFYLIYTIGLVFFTQLITLHERINLILLTGSLFLALTAFDVVPILFDRLTGNMYVFGHLGDIKTVSIDMVEPYIRIVLIALPLSLLLRFGLKQLTPVYLASIFLTVFMLLLLIIGRHAGFMILMKSILHFGIHFTYYWRFAIYFCLLAFINFIFLMDALTRLSYRLIETSYPKLGGRVNEC